jgi:hypothetical protein
LISQLFGDHTPILGVVVAHRLISNSYSQVYVSSSHDNSILSQVWECPHWTTLIPTFIQGLSPIIALAVLWLHFLAILVSFVIFVLFV